MRSAHQHALELTITSLRNGGVQTRSRRVSHSTSLHPHSIAHIRMKLPQRIIRRVSHFTSLLPHTGRRKGQPQRILNQASGVARPGEIVAVMGPSGAGKSTLLDIVSGRSKRGKVQGSVRYNGNHLSPRMRRLIGCVCVCSGCNHLSPAMRRLIECVLASAGACASPPF